MTTEQLQVKAEQLQSLCYEPEEWAGYTLCGSSFDQRKAIEFLSTFRTECRNEAFEDVAKHFDSEAKRYLFDHREEPNEGTHVSEWAARVIRSLKTQTEDK